MAWQRARLQIALELGVLVPDLEPFRDERWAVLHVFGQYVDDGGGASIDDLLFDQLGRPMRDSDGTHLSRAQLHLELVEDVFDAFGHLSSPEKRVIGVRIDLLGVEMDLVAGRMRLAPGKRERYAASCRAVSISQSGVPLTEFRELHLRLDSLYPKGRQWVAPCWRSFKISLKRSPVQKVFITRHVWEALQRWAVELEDPEHVGVPMACREWHPSSTASSQTVPRCDCASRDSTCVSSFGWCTFAECRWRLLVSTLGKRSARTPRSTVLRCLPSPLACLLACPRLLLMLECGGLFIVCIFSIMQHRCD